jgi:hypothetical protein
MLRFQAICDRCFTVHDRGLPTDQLTREMSAREHAQREGWHYDEDRGIDLCGQCLHRMKSLMGRWIESRR